MPSALKTKLKSESGISMALALVFFLLCVAVSGIVITAASASAGVAIGNRETQQGYLAVASAARLVMEDLKELEYTEVYASGQLTAPSTAASAYSLDTASSGFSGSRLVTDPSAPTARFTLSFSGGKAHVESAGTEPSYKLIFPELAAKGIPAVKGEISMDAGFGLTVVLTDGDRIGDGENEIRIRYIPVISQPVLTTADNRYSGASETAVYKYTATVKWGEPMVSGMGATA